MRHQVELSKNGNLKITATDPNENLLGMLNSQRAGFDAVPYYNKKENSITYTLKTDNDYKALKSFLTEMYSMSVSVGGTEKYNWDKKMIDKESLQDSIQLLRQSVDSSHQSGSSNVLLKFLSRLQSSKVFSPSSSSVNTNVDPKDLYRPRKIDLEKDQPNKTRQGFDKLEKYAGQKIVDDTKHRIGGHTSVVGGVLRYTSSTSQQEKERFMQPARLEGYFTYYCYEIYQYCGVNTPKYRYASDIDGKFTNISTLIPPDKIPKRDVLLENKEIFKSDEPKLNLLDNQLLENLNSGTQAKISGNFFGADLVGFLLQNNDALHAERAGALNGYFIERQNRQHYIVIDMDKVTFKDYDPDKARQIKLLNDGFKGGFNGVSSAEHQLAVVSKIDQLLKGDLEKIYYSPRATQMFFELQPQLAKALLEYAAFRAYGFQGDVKSLTTILNEFGEEIKKLMGATSETERNVVTLCEQIRAMALTYRDKIAALPGTLIAESKSKSDLEKASLRNRVGASQKDIGASKDDKYEQWQIECDTCFEESLNNPIYSPDLQVKEIRAHGEVLLEHFANAPHVLRDFETREMERGRIADEVIGRLNIKSPDDLVVKGYIIEDLRGKYYEKLSGQALIDKLVEAFSQELGLQQQASRKPWTMRY